MSWKQPITWVTKQKLTATELNKQIRDNTAYLFRRARAQITVPGDGIDFTITADMTGINGVPAIELDSSGADIELFFTTHVTGGSRLITFDIFVDDTYYISNLKTVSSAGVTRVTTNGASIENITQKIVVTGLAVGLHKFELRVMGSTSGATLQLNGWLLQFGAIEV